MAYSNIQAALVRKYRAWLSEKHQLSRQIDQIEKANLTLEEKRSRAQCLELLLNSIETIMSEVAPDWDKDDVKPAQRHVNTLPFEDGEVTRWTLDAMREAPSRLRTRDITDIIMDRKGLDRGDKELVDRVRKAVDGTLQSMKRRNHVGNTEEWPARWFILDRNA